jgi:hypothetical protein
VVAALGLAAVLVPPTFGAGALTLADCPEPYAPVFGFAGGRSGSGLEQIWPDQPVQQPSFAGPRLSLRDAMVEAGVDVDGDGRRDGVLVDFVDDEQVLVVTTASGDIRVGASGFNLGSLDGNPVGDLDGDGLDELLFLARPADGGPDDVYVLPGGTAPGEYRPAEVGIEIPTYQVLPAGEWLGGPGHDLVVGSWDGTTASTAVVDGHEVMAVGPGGSSDFAPSDDPVPGFPGGSFDLGAGRVAFATIVADPSTTGPIEIHLHDRSGALSRFASPDSLPYPVIPYSVDVVDDGERRLLTASHGDRGGSTGFVWDIDEPCRPLPPREGGPTTVPGGPSTPATPTAPPAGPRPGSPSYAG